MLAGRPAAYDAPAIHLDIVAVPPADCTGARDECRVGRPGRRDPPGRRHLWGVQYHPEFSLAELAAILGRRVEILVAEGFCDALEDAASYVADLTALHAEPARRDSPGGTASTRRCSIPCGAPARSAGSSRNGSGPRRAPADGLEGNAAEEGLLRRPRLAGTKPRSKRFLPSEANPQRLAAKHQGGVHATRALRPSRRHVGSRCGGCRGPLRRQARLRRLRPHRLRARPTWRLLFCRHPGTAFRRRRGAGSSAGHPSASGTGRHRAGSAAGRCSRRAGCPGSAWPGQHLQGGGGLPEAAARASAGRCGGRASARPSAGRQPQRRPHPAACSRPVRSRPRRAVRAPGRRPPPSRPPRLRRPRARTPPLRRRPARPGRSLRPLSR